MKSKYKYLCTFPDASALMDNRKMEHWLNFMDSEGWEFVGYAQKSWIDQPIPQDWWIFRKKIVINNHRSKK